MTIKNLPLKSVNTESDVIFLLGKLAEKAANYEGYIKLADAAYIAFETMNIEIESSEYFSDGLFYMDQDMVSDCWGDYQKETGENEGY